MKKSNIWKVILGLIIGVLFLGIWSKFIDVKDIVPYFRSVKLSYVVIAAFLYLLSYFVRSLRWNKLLSVNLKMGAGRTFLIWMAGNFINYMIPVRAGELAKSFFVKKTTGVPISKTLPSVFIDKMFDSVSIFLVLILLPFLNVHVSDYLLFLIIMLIAVFFVGFTILILSAIKKDEIIAFLHRWSKYIPYKYEKKYEDIVQLFVEGVAIFKNHYVLLPELLILTLLAVSIDSVYFLFMFKAFNQEINYFMILFGYTLIYLSYVIPHPPAQIGSNELVMIIVFSAGLGLDKTMVSAVMAFAHLLTGGLIILVGFIAISYSGYKIIDVIETGAIENEK